MPTRISMRAIAERAGVSAMTVSLALRGSPEISKTTRDSIRALAEEMGFRPDPALRALIHYRKTKRRHALSNTIAFINNTSYPSSLPINEIYGVTFRGASERAAELGYKLEEFWAREPGLTPKRASSVLQARGISGLIIAPQEKSHTTMDLCWESFSAVAIGLSLEQPRLHVVINNMFKSMLLCTQRLMGLGYRRIGLAICREQDERVEHRYIGAYLAACEDFNAALPIHRPTVPEKKAFLTWFRKHHPEVIIGTERAFADYLKEEGLSIPEDVGFASIFNTAELNPYAHVDGKAAEIGKVAAELVSSMIDRNETGIPVRAQQITIEPEWILKDTVRVVRQPGIP